MIRNVGGRVAPAVLHELTLLRGVTQAAGGDLGAGWELIVLPHTDCGITRLGSHPGPLAAHLGVNESSPASTPLADPYAAVAADVATLRAETRLGPGIVVSGLIYDVATGLIEEVDRAGAPA